VDGARDIDIVGVSAGSASKGYAAGVVARLKRLVERGRRSGPSDVDGEAALDRLNEKYRRRK
jgi:hypothetical protein